MINSETPIDYDRQHLMASSLRFLPLIKNEIIISVESLAKNLETYLANRSKTSALAHFFEELDRIEGCFFVLELVSLRLFTDKLSRLARHCFSVDEDEKPLNEHQLNTLTNGFFLIHRYLEFLSFRWQDTPELLIPEINRICRLLNEPVYPLCYFSVIHSDDIRLLNTRELNQALLSDKPHPSPFIPSIPPSLEFYDALKRFRLMYQIGLLSILSNRDWSFGLVLLSRSLQHLSTYGANSSGFPLWFLSQLLVDRLLKRSKALDPSGAGAICSLVVTVLCDIEKCIRVWQIGGEAIAQQAPNEALIRDVLYWLALEEEPSPQITQVLSLFNVASNDEASNNNAEAKHDNDAKNDAKKVSAGNALDQQPEGEVKDEPFFPVRLAKRLSHLELWRAFTLLHGPSLQTRQSVVALLNNDIRQINDTLNVSIKHDPEEYIDLLINQLRTVSETLKLLELNSTAEHLTHLNQALEKQRTQEQSPSRALLESIVEALVMTDNRVQEFAEVIDEADQASGELQIQSAQKTLLSEVIQALQISKSQLQLFGDSGCQYSELDAIDARFEEIIGGLSMLDLPRAKAIVSGCQDFVSQYLRPTHNDAKASGDRTLTLALLDTFADVIVSLEFYFHGLSLSRKMDDRILALAEESLHALGISVV